MAFYNRGIRARVRRLNPPRIAEAYRKRNAGELVYVDWLNRGPVARNWGDAVAPILVEKMTGRRAVNQRDYPRFKDVPVYATIGSMLGTIAGNRVHVWGTGFIEEASTLRCRPERIHAVRGPLTAARLIDLGLGAKPAIGDPALLTPHFFDPPPSNPAVFGFIPHYREFDMPLVRVIRESGAAKVIDICAGIEEVVAEIKGCQAIASGSLHGLVVADSFEKATTWAALSDRPAGFGFKFRDYLQSVGRNQSKPIAVREISDILECHDRAHAGPLSIDLEALLESNPFDWRPERNSQR